MSELKNRLHRELAIKNAVQVEGIEADPEIFRGLGLGERFQEQIHTLFEYNHQTHVGIDLPVCFYTPGGLRISFRWDRHSPYRLHKDGARYVLLKGQEELFPVRFKTRPKYYGLKTSDGAAMSQVATHNGEGAIFVAYSNECFLSTLPSMENEIRHRTWWRI